MDSSNVQFMMNKKKSVFGNYEHVFFFWQLTGQQVVSKNMESLRNISGNLT